MNLPSILILLVSTFTTYPASASTFDSHGSNTIDLSTRTATTLDLPKSHTRVHARRDPSARADPPALIPDAAGDDAIARAAFVPHDTKGPIHPIHSHARRSVDSATSQDSEGSWVLCPTPLPEKPVLKSTNPVGDEQRCECAEIGLRSCNDDDDVLMQCRSVETRADGYEKLVWTEEVKCPGECRISGVGKPVCV